MDCIFCKIVAGDIPSTKVYEDDTVLAFRDINPEAPVHILIIPKEHISSANEINDTNSAIIAHIFETIPKIAAEEKLDGGYRILTNIGKDGGQSVHPLHFDILGGKQLPLKLA